MKYIKKILNKAIVTLIIASLFVPNFVYAGENTNRGDEFPFVIMTEDNVKLEAKYLGRTIYRDIYIIALPYNTEELKVAEENGYTYSVPDEFHEDPARKFFVRTGYSVFVDGRNNRKGKTQNGQHEKYMSFVNADGTMRLPLKYFALEKSEIPYNVESITWWDDREYKAMRASAKGGISAGIIFIMGEMPEIGEHQEEDKTDLRAAISKVWDKNLNEYTDTYYRENDRYNGKEYNEKGFFKEIEHSLKRAKNVEADAKASKQEIENATSNLNKAISKLIPIDRINPTALYESINKKVIWEGDNSTGIFKAVPTNYVNDIREVSEENTTPETWAPYKEALNEAEALLASLYDEDGNPTDVNNVNNYHVVKAVIAKLEAAVGGLKDRIKFDDELALKRVDFFKRSILMFAEKYDVSKLPEGRYTEESVADLAVKMANALEFKDKNYTKDILVREYVAVHKAFIELKNACYGLVDRDKGEISVRLSTTSPVSLYDGVSSVDTVTKTLTLPSGAGLKGVIKSEAGSLLEFDKLWRTTFDERYAGLKIDVPYNNHIFDNVLIYVNGELYPLNENYKSEGMLGISSYFNFMSDDAVKLKDGDEILLTLAPMRVESLSSQVGLRELLFDEIADSMMYQRIEAPERVKPGEEFEITVVSDGATALNHLEKNTPVKGGDIYVGAAKEDKEEAGKQHIDIPMYAKTDENGKAKLTLYSEGWNALNVFHPESNGSEINGMTVMIYVEPSSDLEGIKKKLTKELTDRYEDINYPKEYFSDEDWNSIVSFFETGIDGIKDAATSGEAREKEFASLQGIIGLQKKADKNNKMNLNGFKEILASLPDEVEKLDESAKFPIERLKYFRDKMTEWQIGKLTPVEEAKYQAVMEVFEKGLKPAVEYGVSIEEDYSAVPEADRETLKSMVKWLKENTAKEDRSGDVGGNELAGLFTVNEVKSGNDYNYSRIYEKLDKAPAFKRVVAIVSPDYSAYFHLRDKGGMIEADDKSWEINDDNGKFSAVPDQADMSLGSYTVGKANYIVNGRQYEVKSIEAAGLEKEKPDLSEAVQFDYVKVGQKVNLAFRNSIVDFEMPYNDVKITVRWAPVGGDAESEKPAAVEAVKAAYSAYNKELYSESNWEALTSAKEEGLTKIGEASTYDEVVSLRKETIAKMAAVRTKAQEQISAPGTQTPVPDFGKSVGKVRIIVENQTFKEATKATGNREPAWHGTLIDGWYELCERDTMMTAVLKALRLKNCRWSTGSQGNVTEWDGYGINYLSGILVPEGTKADGADFKYNKEERLAEFSGENGSGWMGTLNDWFTNFGFQEFGVENGELHSGDEIRIQYTQNLGVDLSGTWGNSDTSLRALDITGGKLLPVFDGKNVEYQLVISGERSMLRVTPTASNKNYLTKIFLNYYDSDSAFYSRTESISVKSGDVLYVGVGEKSWPSMNKQGAEARDYTGTKYTIKVFGSDKAGVNARIEALPDSGKIGIKNYKQWEEIARSLKADYDALSDKNGLNADKIKEVSDKIKFWSEIDDAKTKLAALPYLKSPKPEQALKYMTAINAAKAAYGKLNDEQKKHITVGDAANYNSLAKALGIALIAGAADKPEVETSKEGGVGTTTVKTEVAVTGAIADITVKEANAAEMVKQAKENKSTEIVLDAKVDEADADTVRIELPKKVADNIINDTKADLTVKLPEAEVKLSQTALKEIASQAKGDKLTVEVSKIKNPTEEQKKSAGNSAEVFGLTVKSGDNVIHSFGAGKVNVRKLIPERLTEKKIAAIYIPEKGDIEVMSGKRVTLDKKNWYEFTTSHFSDFALVDAEEVGIEVGEAMTSDEVKAVVKELRLKATTKALKKSIRVTVKADKEALMKLKESGYEVKYKYYRAVKKSGRYKLIATKKADRFTNTKITKGKTYYYKARLAVYDGEGKQIAITSIKNCNASKRQLKKAA